MSDKYPITILHYANPHLIWVEAINPKRAESFEQIGIYGVLPLVPEIDIMTNKIIQKKVNTWAPGVVEIMKKILIDAEDIVFEPKITGDKNSIFNNEVHKFGEIYFTREGKTVALSDELCETYFCARHERIFLSKLNSSRLQTVLDPMQTEKVIKAVKTASRERATKKPFYKARRDMDEASTTSELTELTEDNLRQHEFECGNFEEEEKLELWKQADEKRTEDTSSEDSMGQLGVPSVEMEPVPLCHKKLLLIKKLEEYKAGKKKASAQEEPKPEATERKILWQPPKIPKFVPTHRYSQQVQGLQGTSDSNECTRQNNYNINKSSGTDFRNSLPRNDTAKNHPFLNPKSNTKVESKERVSYSKVPSEGARPKLIVRDNNREASLNISTDSHFSHAEVNRASNVPKINKAHNNKATSKNRNDSDFSSDDELRYSAYVPKPKTHHKKSPGNNSQVDTITQFRVSPIEDLYVKHCKNVREGRIRSKKLDLTHKLVKSNDILANNNVPYDEDSTLTNDDSTVTKATNDTNLTNDSKFLSVDSDNETTISSLAKVLGLDQTNKNIRTTDRDSSNVTTTSKYVTTPNVCPVNVFQNMDFDCSKFIEKIINAVILVHAKSNFRIQPTMDLSDVHFTEYIMSVLNRMEVTQPMILQSVSWPCILRGYSVFMISPPRSGKTFGYIPAVCRLVSDDASSEGKGPTAIIICATAKSVMCIEKKCKAMLGSRGSVVSYFAGKNEIEVATMLINGCDMFITTPCAIVRLLSDPNTALNLKNLTILVLDDCERIDKVYINELKYLLLKIKDMLRYRLNKEQCVQYIVASRVWCPFMEGLAKKAPHSVVSISAFHESVVYSKAHTSVSFVDSSNKIKVLTEFLTDIDSSKRTVIVCKTDDEVKRVHEVLQQMHYIVFVGDSNMTVENLYRLNDQLTQYDAPFIGSILLCCDQNLTYLNVTNASYLIHYSLPDMFSTFCKRFSVLTDNYASIFKDTKTDVKIKIMIEETNVEQLPKMLNFIKRCNTNVPESLDMISEKIMTKKEYIKAKTLVPVCEKLLSFGECFNYWYCNERHWLFTEYDTPPEWIPTEGVVCFHMMAYYNAVKYTASLISNSINGSSTSYPQTYVAMCLKIDMHFMNDLNRIPLGVPKLGDICAVAATANHFQRCQVVRILSKHKNGNAKDVAIKILDEARYERTTDAYLYELPDKFKDYNAYVVQVQLAGLLPKDRDLMFSDLAKNHLMRLVNKNEGMFMRANIVMTIGNTIIVDNLKVCQRISKLNDVVVRYDFKEELLSDHACVNEDHVRMLKELCAKCDFVIKDETEVQVQVPKQKLPEIRWAHLNADVLSLVYFASAQSPDKFYIILDEFQDCLRILSRDIEEYVKDAQPLQYIQLGYYVIAEFPDNEMHYRARIDEISDNNIKCFFVDHGHWRFVHRDKLFAITNKHVTQLPFQAIECRLAGVKPCSENWSDFCTNYFCDLCHTDDLKGLFAKYFFKEKSDDTNANKYGVVIVNTSGVEDLFVNQALIKENLAQPIVDEIQLLNDFIDSSQINDTEENNTKETNDVEVELGAESNFVIKDETEVQVPKQKLPEPTWAQLNEDELSLGYLSSAETPDKFFIRLDNFENCLEILSKDIEVYIKDVHPLLYINLGDYVIAEFPDNKMHNRARIDEITDNNVKCFFVDHGDWRFVRRDKLFAITDKLVTQLPFQAIECRLAGVKPCSENWSDSCTNYFCDLCYVGETDDLKKLFVQYFIKEEAESTNGNKYVVVIVDTSGIVDLVLNEALIKANLAQPIDGEIQLLNDIIKSQIGDPQEKETTETNNSVKVDEINGSMNSVQKSSAVQHLFQTPIRSVPLVDEDYDSDEWDVELSNDQISKILGTDSILSQLIKKSSNNTDRRLPVLHDVINQPEETRNRVSMTELASLSLQADETANSSHPSVNSDETLKLVSEIELPKPIDRISKLLSKISKNTVPELDSDDISTPSSSSKSCIQAVKRPKLSWKQNIWYLNVKFDINGIKTYKLNIEDDRIEFSTRVDDQLHKFDVKLYGVVNVNQCTHALKGNRVYIKLKKLIRLKWMDLTKERNQGWISYDVDAIDTSSEESVSTNYRAKIKKMVKDNYRDESDMESSLSFKDDIDDLL